MIISASRRTDIPAFYAKWFINRIRAGFCTVPNPFNPNQVSRISLKPQDVDIIVFWTRNPAPLIRYVQELDDLGFRYYFQYTLLNNPKELDRNGPGFERSIDIFQQISKKVGAERVIWRYDPIVLTEKTGMHFHMETYRQIAEQLQGFTKRSVISLMDPYRKIQKRMNELEKEGLKVFDVPDSKGSRFDILMRTLARTAEQNGMELLSCAEEIELSKYGISAGKCIDAGYIKKIFGIDVENKKDPVQRKTCGCVVSRDIGMYNTCMFGCQYCYATSNFELARKNHAQHDPNSPSLVGWYEIEKNSQELQLDMFSDGS